MSYRDGRRSLCLSSQSGCPLTCNFCATGRMAFGRNLTASEILDQALHFRRTGEVNHVVFMGMGEPLMNLDAVIGACERLPEVGVSTAHTTVSTVGWVPGIERLVTEGPRVRLALSLHAAEGDVRSGLMPVNDRYPLAEVIESCLRWRAARKRKVYIEYLMLDGVNDAPDQAVVLSEVLEPHEAFKVNLIPFNPTPGEFTGSSREAIAAFRDTLLDQGIPTTIRLTRGRDIQAACGQLRDGCRDGLGPSQLSSMRSITCGSTGRSPGPVSVPSIASTASIPDDDLAEDGVLAVEPGRRVDRDDEELGAVRVRAGVGHRERAAVDLVVVELVLERVAGAAGARSLRAAALDHEVGDHAVEDRGRRRSRRAASLRKFSTVFGASSSRSSSSIGPALVCMVACRHA